MPRSIHGPISKLHERESSVTSPRPHLIGKRNGHPFNGPYLREELIEQDAVTSGARLPTYTDLSGDL